MNLHRIDLHRAAERAEVEGFLNENGLRLEPLDTGFGIRNDRGALVGFGGRAGDVLKCFAFDDAYRGQALMDSLITALITDAFHAGIEDLLVYTKADYLALFTHFGFREVAKSKSVALLQRGKNTPEKAMQALGVDTGSAVKNGAVVINANPFTLGHRALVEHAAASSERLLVFVVEHDASFFPFTDRFRLVQEGVSHLDNVVVLPSTRYIISASTFPSYFLKESEVGEVEHALLDAEIFVRWFVPYFSIVKRYVGEEPTDQTTANYNAALRKVLPPACEVEVIPRKQAEGAVISASTVRRALKNGDWSSIEKSVPQTTYQYLQAHYGTD